MGKKRRSRQFKQENNVINIEDARKERREKRKQEMERKQEKKARFENSHASKRRSVQVRRRRLAYVVIFLVIFSIVLYSACHLISLKKAENDVLKKNEQLQEEQKRKEKELSQVDNPDYIEQQARTQLHMIKPGETIYVLPEEEKVDQKATEEAVEKKKIMDEKSGDGE